MSRTIPNYDTSGEDPFAGLPVGNEKPAPAIRTVRANMYAGNCGLCGVRVDIGAGRIERVNGKWVTYHLNDCPPLIEAPPAPVHVALTDGMYRTPEGVIYKVQIAHHGSGNLYAKRMVPVENWDLEIHGKRKAGFQYEPGAIKKLRPEMKMTLEEAKAFGHLYGMCCVCGAILTDEYSIANGIGPVCGRKKGWF